MPTSAPASQPTFTKRGLIIHDATAFAALLAVSCVLFAVTLLLFKSFQQHRIDLAQRWSLRGKQALAHGKPEEAVGALRTALSYTPDGPEARAEQLMLADALAAAGHEDEATNYYLNLWDSHPGDGLINLQLARLARQRHEDSEATDYYRAAVYGSWEGDAVPRRREVRLELTDFLIEQHRNAEARNELFTIAGNSPSDPKLAILVAEKLEQAGYPADAIGFYAKASQLAPHERFPLVRAGEAAYRLGDYHQAATFLHHALEEKPGPDAAAEDESRVAALEASAVRIQQLSLDNTLPAQERTTHLAADEKLARARLKACMASTAGDNALAGVLASWTALDAGPNPGAKPARHAAMPMTAADQDNLARLIYSTEQVTASSCGTPSGDDALLLQLADKAQPQPEVAPAPAAVLPPQTPVVPSLKRLFGRKEAANHGK